MQCWTPCVVLSLLLMRSRWCADAMIFDSVARVRALLADGGRVVQLFEDQRLETTENWDMIQQYFIKLRSWTSDLPQGDVRERDARITELVEHPINAFNIVRDWVVLGNLVGGPQSHIYTAVSADAAAFGVRLTNNDDYWGALKALVRLQKTYVLTTVDLAAGTVYNRTAKYGLAMDDWYELGILWLPTDHEFALSWFMLILDTGGYNSDMERKIHRQLMTIHKEAGNYNLALISADKTWNKDVADPANAEIMSEIRQILQREGTDKAGLDSDHSCYWKKPATYEYYEELCRGEHIRNSILVNKDLMCVYRRGVAPYVRYKEEIHSFSPRISLLHDVISDRQAAYLKQMALPELSVSYIGYTTANISDTRTSELTWVTDSDPTIWKISAKVADITGLSTNYKPTYAHAEPYQVVNYGMGGQYEPHYDFYDGVDPDNVLKLLPEMFRNSGDRISTFMFYLNDVTAGGATVFPALGVRVPPVKNAAAYWYNYNLNAVRDLNTKHAGCPVLLGQKWVANKWFREEGNIFKRPCSLQKDQMDPIWYK